MERVQRLDTQRTWVDLLVILTDDAGIRVINRDVFGRDTATDVISLSYAPMPPDLTAWSAEIIVNVQRAVVEGRRIGQRWNREKELALYLAHGCNHLLGEDDADPAGRARMRRRELRWLRRLAEADLTGHVMA